MSIKPYGDMSVQQPPPYNPEMLPPVVAQPQPMPMMMAPQQPQVQVQVVTQQPTSSPQERQWSSSVCGCFEDMSSCCCIFFCGQYYVCCCLSERMGEHCCTPVCLGCADPSGHLTVLTYRVKLRAKHNISGSVTNDCCCACCCAGCVLCQIKREIDYIEQQTGKKAF